MVNGTQVVGCGEMSETRVRVEQFAGARVFRNFQGLLNPTPNAATRSRSSIIMARRYTGSRRYPERCPGRILACTSRERRRRWRRRPRSP